MVDVVEKLRDAPNKSLTPADYFALVREAASEIEARRKNEAELRDSLNALLDERARLSRAGASGVEAVHEALEQCEEYFDNRADADCDQDGFIPNKEMRLLSVVRDARAALSASPAPSQGDEVDLEHEMFSSIADAAVNSSWLPSDYSMNDWVKVVCAFLRDGPSPVPSPSPAGGVREALEWTDRQIAAAKRVMKESAHDGNGYANFAAHDAHKHLTTIRAALSAPAPAPESALGEAVLRAALEPFADAAEELEPNHSDSSDIWECPVAMSITAGHLRAALAALALTPTAPADGGENG